MKNRFLIFLGLSLLAGCAGSSPLWSEPPGLVASVEGEELGFTLGSYHWNRTIADSPASDRLVEGEPYHRVSPGAEATLRFSRDAPAETRAGLWEDGGMIELQRAEGGFRLPSEPGEYVVTVVAVWPNKDRATYAAPVEVVYEK